jgi:hypothetical protein
VSAAATNQDADQDFSPGVITAFDVSVLVELAITEQKPPGVEKLIRTVFLFEQPSRRSLPEVRVRLIPFPHDFFPSGLKRAFT